jgi:hypothetical protein
MTHKLYAKIKRTSKYFCQNEWAKRRGELPFPVQIVPHPQEDYWVQGDPVGWYRLSDVNLYLIENGYEIKLAIVDVKRKKAK